MSVVSEWANSSKILEDVENYRDEEDTHLEVEGEVSTSGWMVDDDAEESELEEEKERRMTPRVDDMASCNHLDQIEKKLGCIPSFKIAMFSFNL